jgi:hypothetical protein
MNWSFSDGDPRGSFLLQVRGIMDAADNRLCTE